MDTTNMPVENAKNREAGSEESPEISRDETGVKTLSLKQKILSRNVVLSILFLISYIGLYFLMFNPNVCVMIEPLDAKTARITKYLYLVARDFIVIFLCFQKRCLGKIYHNRLKAGGNNYGRNHDWLYGCLVYHKLSGSIEARYLYTYFGVCHICNLLLHH